MLFSGFYEYLVLDLSAKRTTLFDTGNILTDAFDVATVHSTLFQILSNDLVGSLICVVYKAPVLGGLLGDSIETSQDGVRPRADIQAENNPPNVRRSEEVYPFSGANTNGRALSRSANASPAHAGPAARLLFVTDVDFSTQNVPVVNTTELVRRSVPSGFRSRLLCPLQPLNPRQIAETDSSWVDVPKYPERHSYSALSACALVVNCRALTHLAPGNECRLGLWQARYAIQGIDFRNKVIFTTDGQYRGRTFVRWPRGFGSLAAFSRPCG